MSAETLEHLIRTYGYVAVIIGTFLEGETFLIIAGLSAHLGYLELPLVIATAFIGSFSGDQMFFCVGRLRGRKLISKHPEWCRNVDRIHAALHRYKDLVMIGFRFVYGIRILTPIVLGMNHQISTGRFVLFNAFGAVVWSVIIPVGGYFFGMALETAIKDIKHYGIEVIIVVSIIAAVAWVVRVARQKRNEKSCPPSRDS